MNFEVSGQSSNDDCYFYFYSSCTKGDECPFRHCQQALGTETVCSQWKEGRCFRSNCKFRHMESRINRGTIPCYWENQPGGCRKPHCVFLHRKLKNAVQPVKASTGLILPTFDGKLSPKLPEVIEQKKSVSANPRTPESFQDGTEDFSPDPSSVPVTPLVLSFDEAEESDTESVSSTPVKLPSNDTRTGSSGLAKSNLASRLSDGASGDKDFGIKTLEQIRMEKIHKESDNYYYTDNTSGKGFLNVCLDANQNQSLLGDPLVCYSGYDSPTLDSARHLESCSKEYYPPQSEFISLPAGGTPMDKTLSTVVKDTKQLTTDKETDLRNRLCKRLSPSNKMNTTKKLISFKKQDKTEENSDPLGFKIKTLAEIRKERENKQEDNHHSSSRITAPSDEHKSENNIILKPAKKLKLIRRPNEVHAASVQNAKSIPDALMRYSKLTMDSNGIAKVSIDKELNHIPSNKTIKHTSPVKRKIELFDVRDNKSIKLDSNSSANDGSNMKTTFSNGKLDNKADKSTALGIQSFLRHTKRSSPARETEPDMSSDDVFNSSSVSELSASSKEVNSELSPSGGDSQTESVNTSVKADNGHSISPITAKTELDISEKVSREDIAIVRTHSVDEFEHLLNEAGMDVDEMEENSGENDDILLKIEQFLDS